MTALIEAIKVTKVFGGGLFDRTKTTALDDFSLSLQTDPPTITAIVGESGSGKTTLARVLLGLSEPSEGTVLYQGKDITKLNGTERREFRRSVQVIFQDPFEVYNPFYQVDHVLTTPLFKFGIAKTKEEAYKLMVDVLETVGLRSEETLGRYPHQLSGGQRQRIMVARALLLHPKLIIADEPVSMIDASLRATVLGSLRQLNSEFGISIIYITHDLTTAYQISDNIIVMYRGSVAECGDVEYVVRDPQHPYTRLLVGSVPLPDPTKLWSKEAAAALAVQTMSKPGCKFVDRCPSATTKCLDNVPPMYKTNDHRAVSCFLYESSPTISTGSLDEVFVESRVGRLRHQAK